MPAERKTYTPPAALLRGVKPLRPENVKFIAIHCSATPPSMDIGAWDIDRMHRLRGFLTLGYHFVIRRDGTVEPGRPLDKMGAHVESHNHCSVGVCLIGGVDEETKRRAEDNFTEDQLASLYGLVKKLRLQFPQATVQGHRDFPNVAKDCPSFSVGQWLAERGL